MGDRSDVTEADTEVHEKVHACETRLVELVDYEVDLEEERFRSSELFLKQGLVSFYAFVDDFVKACPRCQKVRLKMTQYIKPEVRTLIPDGYIFFIQKIKH